jgi:hypothetical protein
VGPDEIPPSIVTPSYWNAWAAWNNEMDPEAQWTYFEVGLNNFKRQAETLQAAPQKAGIQWKRRSGIGWRREQPSRNSAPGSTG